jgi:hypothetical protein
METVALRVRDYPGLLRQLDRRRCELGLRMEDVDAKSGVQDGYAAKLFVGVRRFGEMSLPAILGALECDLVIVPRPKAEAAPAERRTHVEPALIPGATRLLALPSPAEGTSP